MHKINNGCPLDITPSGLLIDIMSTKNNQTSTSNKNCAPAIMHPKPDKSRMDPSV